VVRDFRTSIVRKSRYSSLDIIHTVQYSTGIFRLVLIAGYQTSTGTLEKFSEFMSKGGILEGTMKIKSRLGSARFK
jgi:hypothetical protein